MVEFNIVWVYVSHFVYLVSFSVFQTGDDFVSYVAVCRFLFLIVAFVSYTYVAMPAVFIFCFPEISKQGFAAAELVVADIVFHGIDSHFEKFPSLFVNVFRYDDFLGYYSVLQIFDMGDVFLRYEPYDVSF